VKIEETVAVFVRVKRGGEVQRVAVLCTVSAANGRLGSEVEMRENF
jgi:hypothetical protein